MRVSPARVADSDGDRVQAARQRPQCQRARTHRSPDDDSGFDFDATAANAEVALAALTWVEQARAGDVLSVWGGMDADFRLSYAQIPDQSRRGWS